jgi:hypothetical protein
MCSPRKQVEDGRTVEAGGATDTGSATGSEGGAKAIGCGCFPGDTGVATPHGLRAIASLKVGDLVLAEDPATGKVEPEKVQALIRRRGQAADAGRHERREQPAGHDQPSLLCG